MAKCECAKFIEESGLESRDYVSLPSGREGYAIFQLNPRYQLYYGVYGYGSVLPGRREVVWSMLGASYLFRIKDGTVENWKAHITARENIIKATTMAGFSFTARDSGHIPARGATPYDAMMWALTTGGDEGAHVGCATGSMIVFLAGIVMTLGPEEFNREFALAKMNDKDANIFSVAQKWVGSRETWNERDWIPGDRGGIPNPRIRLGTTRPADIPFGYEGYNVIYVGGGYGDNFWAHGSGGSNRHDIDFYKEKLRPYSGGQEIEVAPYRNHPKIGLEQ